MNHHTGNCCEQCHGIWRRNGSPCPAEGGSLYFPWRSQSLTLQTQKLQFKFFFFLKFSFTMCTAWKWQRSLKKKKKKKHWRTTQDWNALMFWNQNEWIISGGDRKIKVQEGEIPCGCAAAKLSFFVRYSKQKYQAISDNTDYWQELQSLSFLSSLSGAESGALGSPLRTSSLDSEL